MRIKVTFLSLCFYDTKNIFQKGKHWLLILYQTHVVDGWGLIITKRRKFQVFRL